MHVYDDSAVRRAVLSIRHSRPKKVWKSENEICLETLAGEIGKGKLKITANFKFNNFCTLTV